MGIVWRRGSVVSPSRSRSNARVRGTSRASSTRAVRDRRTLITSARKATELALAPITTHHHHRIPPIVAAVRGLGGLVAGLVSTRAAAQSASPDDPPGVTRAGG